MSTATTPQLPSTAEAYGNTYQLYNDIFFSKLANEYGIQPQNEAEAASLIEIAGACRAHQQKQASEQNRFLAFQYKLAGAQPDAMQLQLRQQAEESVIQ